ncbi:MAG: winged helix DNA-binding protein [Patescibacteria group bacterium]
MSSRLIEQVLILSNNYKRVADQVLRERLGLTYAKFLVLEQINLGNNTSNVISKNLGKTEASISRQITSLEKDHLIKRRVKETDDRLKIIKLTRKGSLVLKNCHKVIDTYFDSKTTTIKSKDNLIKTLKTVNEDIAQL